MWLKSGTKLPFDISDERTAFYVNDIAGVLELKMKLIQSLEEAMKDSEPDNPIYRAVKADVMQAVEKSGLKKSNKL